VLKEEERVRGLAESDAAGGVALEFEGLGVFDAAEEVSREW
jgi:hypothetical protein